MSDPISIGSRRSDLPLSCGCGNGSGGIYLALVVCLLFCGVMSLRASAGVLSADEAKPSDTLPSAPHFLLKTLNPALSGLETFSTKKHVGEGAVEPRQALVINFMASHCKPCREELPFLKKREPQWRSRGVQVVTITIDKTKAGIEMVRKLVVEDLKLEFPVLTDRFGLVGKRYHATSLPYVVVVNGSGGIVWKQGSYSSDLLDRIENALNTFLPPPKDRRTKRRRR